MVSERKSGVCRFCGSPYHRGWQCKENPKVQKRLEKKKSYTISKQKITPRKAAKHRPKSDRRKLIHKFDEVFSQYIRKKAELNGNLYCFVCGKKLTYDTAVAMHFIGRRAVSVRFDEDNCKVGCRECNAINKDQPEVLRKYENLLGEETVKRLQAKKSVKISTKDLEDLYSEYKRKLLSLD